MVRRDKLHPGMFSTPYEGCIKFKGRVPIGLTNRRIGVHCTFGNAYWRKSPGNISSDGQVNIGQKLSPHVWRVFSGIHLSPAVPGRPAEDLKTVAG